LPGNTATGGVSLAAAQDQARELDQAATLQQEGQYAQAISVYEEVLSQDPKNVEALSQAGWLEFEAGVIGTSTTSFERGETDEQSAVELAPDQALPHAYLATMYFVEGQPGPAVTQYSEFLAEKPAGAEVAPFLPDMKKAFEEEKEKLPPLPSGS
jgi:tetratricopeptide (TPR) repeat protein